MQQEIYTTEKLSALFKQAGQLLKSGDYSQAENNYATILKILPDHIDSLHYLGIIKYLTGENNAAVDYLKKAAELASNDPEIFFNLGCTYQALSQWQNAKQAFERAISLKPDYAMAHNNISIVFVSLNDYQSQYYHIQKAYELAPNELEIMVNYATYLSIKSKYLDTIELLHKALEINPNLEKANVLLCHALYKIGQHTEGYKYLRKIDFFKSKLSGDSSSVLFLYNYEPTASPEEIYKAHHDWGQAILKNIGDKAAPKRSTIKPHAKLRIAYVSPNYCHHPIPYFLESILENHDKTQFDIYTYSNNKDKDQVTKKLKKYFTFWRDIYELSADQLYDLILEDEIDVLIDLAGHSSQHSLSVFARKPSPVQITYLGYPNTTGLPNMDYRITDSWSDPQGKTDKWYTEKLIRLNTGFLCYRPSDNCPPVKAPPYLANGYITFGCFNNPLKINNNVIAVWSKILNGVSSSKLILKDRIFINDEVRKITLNRLEQYGIDEDRVELLANIKMHYDALDAYNRIDIALDPFPYNGTTTTSEALWMGVPLITLVGETHVSRVSYSILKQIGADELAAFSTEEYIQKATILANDKVQLSKLRSELRQKCQQSTFTNGKYFAKLLENVYKETWRIYCQKSQLSDKDHQSF